jgi:hypothetical protein
MKHFVDLFFQPGIMYIKYRQKKSLICLKASTTVFKNTDISYMILTNLNFLKFFCWQSVEKICDVAQNTHYDPYSPVYIRQKRYDLEQIATEGFLGSS